MSPADWEIIGEAEDKQLSGYIATLEKQLAEVPHRVMTPRGNTWDVPRANYKRTSD